MPTITNEQIYEIAKTAMDNLKAVGSAIPEDNAEALEALKKANAGINLIKATFYYKMNFGN